MLKPEVDQVLEYCIICTWVESDTENIFSYLFSKPTTEKGKEGKIMNRKKSRKFETTRKIEKSFLRMRKKNTNGARRIIWARDRNGCGFYENLQQTIKIASCLLTIFLFQMKSVSISWSPFITVNWKLRDSLHTNCVWNHKSKETSREKLAKNAKR